MTRVIKFRGMDLEGRWFFGLPCIITVGRDCGSYISNSCGVPMAYDIRPETLTQFTGLFDGTKFDDLPISEQKNWLKNNKQEDWKGKEVFEGDIVRSVIYAHEVIGSIEWCNEGLYIVNGNPLQDHDFTTLEVIGNIYENGDF